MNKNPILRTVGDVGRAIRAARERVGLEPIAFAKLAGLHINSYRDWENGKKAPSCIRLGRIAVASGVSTDSLLFGETATALLALDLDGEINLSGVTPDQIADLTESVRLMAEICRRFNQGIGPAGTGPAHILLGFIRDCHKLAESLEPAPAQPIKQDRRKSADRPWTKRNKKPNGAPPPLDAINDE